MVQRVSSLISSLVNDWSDTCTWWASPLVITRLFQPIISRVAVHSFANAFTLFCFLGFFNGLLSPPQHWKHFHCLLLLAVCQAKFHPWSLPCSSCISPGYISRFCICDTYLGRTERALWGETHQHGQHLSTAPWHTWCHCGTWHCSSCNNGQSLWHHKYSYIRRMHNRLGYFRQRESKCESCISLLMLVLGQG